MSVKPVRENDDPLLKLKPIRVNDIKEISEFITEAPSKTFRHSLNYYPFRFFADAVQAYWHLFDNAVIYYIGLAVEIALLIRLRADIVQIARDRRNRRFVPSFQWLIRHSDTCLSEELRMKADDLRLMRNCYIHYQNIVAHTAYLDQQEWPKIVEDVKREFSHDHQVLRAIDLLNAEAKRYSEEEGMLTVRLGFLETNNEMMRFIDGRYQKYMIWVSRINRSIATGVTDEEFRILYSIEAFDALSCIQWGFDILTALNCLKIPPKHN